MWPFSKKWSAPAPQLAMIVSLANQELPSLVKLANPSGEDGAVAGMAGPADEKPSPENMLGPLTEGRFIAASPGGALCGLTVERADGSEEALAVEPEMLEASGLTAESLAKFNGPAWRVVIQLVKPGEDVRETVIFATGLARRLAALADGVVMDAYAYRFFGPNGWPVEEPNPDFDAREHVHIHMETDSSWFHTHGLVKFGRPELEIYDVPEELHGAAFGTLLNIAQYVITSAAIEPGQTCGDPNQPFFAREGKRNRGEHWHDLPVLELVDVDERGKPVASGAEKALQLMLDGAE